jgi:hypothetical protein
MACGALSLWFFSLLYKPVRLCLTSKTLSTCFVPFLYCLSRRKHMNTCSPLSFLKFFPEVLSYSHHFIHLLIILLQKIPPKLTKTNNSQSHKMPTNTPHHESTLVPTERAHSGQQHQQHGSEEERTYKCMIFYLELDDDDCGDKETPHTETVREHGTSKLEPPQEAEPAPAEPTAAEAGVWQILKDLFTTRLLSAGAVRFLSISLEPLFRKFRQIHLIPADVITIGDLWSFIELRSVVVF